MTTQYRLMLADGSEIGGGIAYATRDEAEAALQVYLPTVPGLHIQEEQKPQERKYRTITLTGRAPVRIREDLWPCIAHGSYEHFDNEHRFQATRTTDIDIRVRKHKDGRAIVYGVYDYSTRWQREDGLVIKTGELCLEGVELSDAINRVGQQLIERLNGRHEGDHIGDVIADCIAELPPVSLDSADN